MPSCARSGRRRRSNQAYDEAIICIVMTYVSFVSSPKVGPGAIKKYIIGNGAARRLTG